VPVAHACNPRYLGGQDREDGDLRPALAEVSSLPLQNSQSKMDWGCSSSGTTAALQASGPEFKLVSPKKKKGKMWVIDKFRVTRLLLLCIM
jgi:hypothetical protein